MLRERSVRDTSTWQFTEYKDVYMAFIMHKVFLSYLKINKEKKCMFVYVSHNVSYSL